MRARALPAACLFFALAASLSTAAALAASRAVTVERSRSGITVVPPHGCPAGSTYNDQLQYQYCVPNDPQPPNAQLKAIVKAAAIAYATAHHWKSSCSDDQFGFACVLYTPDPTGVGLTTPSNGQPVPSQRATKTLINGVPTAVFEQMSYTALGGSGCAVTLYFGSTYPDTLDGCGPSGLAHVRTALADDARGFG